MRGMFMGNNKTEQPEPEELTGNEKIVYDILCSDETPLNGQHWEGFVAQKIVKALAQPEPEPWAGVDFDVKTVPPQSNWQGLTDDEKEDVLKGSKNAYDAIERIEAKLKEKNT